MYQGGFAKELMLELSCGHPKRGAGRTPDRAEQVARIEGMSHRHSWRWKLCQLGSTGSLARP